MASYIPALLWAGVLLFIGGQSNVPTVETPLPVDKVAHFVMYGVLGLLATLGWLFAGRKPDLRIVLLLAALVGVIDEVHQRSVPHRTSDPIDWMADVAGIAVAATLIVRYKKPNVV